METTGECRTGVRKMRERQCDAGKLLSPWLHAGCPTRSNECVRRKRRAPPHARCPQRARCSGASPCIRRRQVSFRSRFEAHGPTRHSCEFSGRSVRSRCDGVRRNGAAFACDHADHRAARLARVAHESGTRACNLHRVSGAESCRASWTLMVVDGARRFAKSAAHRMHCSCLAASFCVLSVYHVPETVAHRRRIVSSIPWKARHGCATCAYPTKRAVLTRSLACRTQLLHTWTQSLVRSLLSWACLVCVASHQHGGDCTRFSARAVITPPSLSVKVGRATGPFA